MTTAASVDQCPSGEELSVIIRAVNQNEDGHLLKSDWCTRESSPCPSSGMQSVDIEMITWVKIRQRIKSAPLPYVPYVPALNISKPFVSNKSDTQNAVGASSLSVDLPTGNSVVDEFSISPQSLYPHPFMVWFMLPVVALPNAPILQRIDRFPRSLSPNLKPTE